MRNDFYPEGTVRDLLETALVSANTKEVLNDRLQKEVVLTPRFFNNIQYDVVKAVCARLIPQTSPGQTVDLPGMLDERLFSGSGNGWRYASMPSDNDAMLTGIDGIEQTTLLYFEKKFSSIASVHQNEILQSVSDGSVEGTLWKQLPPALFFEELLAILVEIYYSHPIGKENIGEVSMADAKGWNKLGLNNLEVFEPLPIK